MGVEQKRNTYMRSYVAKNRAKIREYRRKWQREWRMSNPQKALVDGRKYRASRLAKIGIEEIRRIGNEACKKWRAKYPEKVKAQKKVFAALRNGSLKKLPCEMCGAHESEAHHLDYSFPLEVIWFCKIHHAQADRHRRMVVEA